MKKYIKEIIVILLQILTFYFMPKIVGNIGTLGMVFLLLVTTFILSIIIGAISKNKIKYLYPIAVSILFIPTIFIYYNESAFVHSLWYLVVSSVGLGIGMFINKISNIKGDNVMDLKKETIKRNVFLVLQIIFLVLTLIGAILVFMKKVDNAGYAVIPMLWSLIFGGFMRESQKKIKDNSNK